MYCQSMKKMVTLLVKHNVYHCIIVACCLLTTSKGFCAWKSPLLTGFAMWCADLVDSSYWIYHLSLSYHPLLFYLLWFVMMGHQLFFPRVPCDDAFKSNWAQPPNAYHRFWEIRGPDVMCRPTMMKALLTRLKCLLTVACCLTQTAASSPSSSPHFRLHNRKWCSALPRGGHTKSSSRSRRLLAQPNKARQRRVDTTASEKNRPTREDSKNLVSLSAPNRRQRRRACGFYLWDAPSALFYYWCHHLQRDCIYEGRGGHKVRTNLKSFLSQLQWYSRCIAGCNHPIFWWLFQQSVCSHRTWFCSSTVVSVPSI